MPTMNKTDLLDCANGSHNYEHGGEHGDPCTVCGHVEPYSIGVEVWLCGTIYVEAASEEEAEKIVTERYGGSLKCSEELMIGARDIRIGDGGEDFLSPTTSIYGLAGDSKLVPEADENAEKHFETIQSALECWAEDCVSDDQEAQDEANQAMSYFRQLAGSTCGAVTAMLAALKGFEEEFGENLDDPTAPLNGGDAVESVCRVWPAIKAAISKAEGGAA